MTTSENLPAGLSRAWRRARRHVFGEWALIGLPLLAACTVLAFRVAGLHAAFGLAMALVVAGIVFVARNLRRYDAAWLSRRLNALDPAFEDSVELVLLSPSPQASAARSTLAQLQQQRLRERLQKQDWPSLNMPVSRMWRAIAWSIALALLMLAWAVPALSHVAQRIETGAVAASAGKLDANIAVHPPAYTGLPAQTVSSFNARAPIGSEIDWTLNLDAGVNAAVLVFDDGSRLALHRDGDRWRAQRTLAASGLYRLERDGVLAVAPLYRIDAIPDQPPEVTVRAPDKTLNLLADGQKTWALAFDARDDYGLGEAELSVSLAQGSGDNVKTSEHTQVLEGSGNAKSRSYRQTLDLGALGFAKGDDLIVRLSVADNRVPEPNRTQSASFILRWPAEADRESTGLDGLVQKVLPAYFRSERQIIIDTEALQAQRGTLEEPRFGKTADNLGVDQKVLRLRYGQFLGEEFESNAEQAPPDAAEAAKKQAAKSDPSGHDSLSNVPAEAGAEQGVGVAGSKVFGDAGNYLAEYGHVHDLPGAATLLDPVTRRILKSALDEMWQAELQLREAQPEAALPYEYKALDYIKQVQQSERIYLARAGVELPQVDATRRLSGKRDDLIDRTLSVAAAQADGSPLPAVWLALQGGNAAAVAAPDWDALENWMRTQPASPSAGSTAASDVASDSLGTIAAAEKLRTQPDCATCAADLKARLWPLLPSPTTAVHSRIEPDAGTAIYLDALSQTSAGTTTTSPSAAGSPP